MTESLTLFIFQLSIIIIAAWLGGRLFEKFNFPSVLGEILAGMLIGPHFLGGISFPGFSGGLFPAPSGGVPVSAELYGIALLASIILLFFVGMETDVGAFLRFSFKAITVGLGGAVLSFFAGNFTGIFLFSLILGPEVSFLHPGPLFLGVISMTTSIGISARILSEKRKMDSPEGVTIISAAVIDDVLGIIALTVVIGIVQSSDILWKDITFIAGRSILIWLGFTAAGIIFYRQLARFLKMFGDRISIAIISLALSFLLAGVFEKSGMAMIVGAYVMGLALSQTDLSGIIQDNLEGLRRFFVPIFFCVMGMMVNFSEISSFAMIAFGLIFTLSSILSKVIGCGVPAYFMNFSLSGSASVGVGMVPRGEVAFTIAGIGLASGVLPREAFSIAVMMTFITAIVTPPVFSAIISSDKPALKKKAPPKIKHREIRVPVPNRETGDILVGKILSTFDSEGFYIQRLGLEVKLFNIRKNEMHITLRREERQLVFVCQSKYESFIHTLLYEVIGEVEFAMKSLQSSVDKKKVGKSIFTTAGGALDQSCGYGSVIHPETAISSLKGNTRKEVVGELLDSIIRSGRLQPDRREHICTKVLEREDNMSTGMQFGIAFPHVRVNVEHLVSAVGIHKKGIDFKSIDKKPSRIFILTLIPEKSNESYLQYIAKVVRILTDENYRKKLLDASSDKELYLLLSSVLKAPKRKKRTD